MSEPAQDPAPIRAALERLGLLRAGETAAFNPLSGGVSSDIWRIDLPTGAVCAKRALPRLKVAANWEAPVERNAYEAAWLQEAGRVVPGSVPRLLGEDTASGTLVMEYLEPGRHPVWKALLRDGVADPAFAGRVGGMIVAIHAATADDARIAAAFRTDAIFHAIRLEPYLLATARAHPDLAGRLEALVATTAGTRRALVHGDVSPKNILAGPDGPILIDAECAWFGDPAFDLAFCLNHMLLKCLWTPAARDGFLACFAVMAQTYVAGVTWEAPEALERRVAHLLPGLLLARVDGKSPAEYLVTEPPKAQVRRFARALLANPTDRLETIREGWAAACGA